MDVKITVFGTYFQSVAQRGSHFDQNSATLKLHVICLRVQKWHLLRRQRNVSKTTFKNTATTHSPTNYNTMSYLHAERVTIQHKVAQRLVFSHTRHEGKTAEFVDGVVAHIQFHQYLRNNGKREVTNKEILCIDVKWVPTTQQKTRYAITKTNSNTPIQLLTLFSISAAPNTPAALPRAL